MKKFLGILASVFVLACGETAGPSADPDNPNNPNVNNPTSNPTDPNSTRPHHPQFPPCVVVPPTPFSSDPLLPSVWIPSYYFTPPARYEIGFTDEGLVFQFEGNNRSGVTFSPEANVESCENLTFRIKGIIHNQTLARSGRDNREAPIAIMIRYTDRNGVLHNSLNAFNASESDDRETTRMFWWGFSYLNDSQFEQNFTPSISNVIQDEEFDLQVNISELADVQTIHSITIEGSGWTLSSKVSYFEMASEHLLGGVQLPPHTQTTQTGEVKVCVKDSTTGEPILSDVDFSAFIGTFGIPALDSQMCTANFPVPIGTYDLSFLGNQHFTPMNETVTIEANQEVKIINLLLNPRFETEGEGIRFVFTWDAQIETSERDLDSHFIGQGIHVFFSNKQDTDSNVWLDIDDTDWQGPETITIKDVGELANGIYDFCVYNWSGQYNNNIPGIISSNPEVKIHDKTGLLQTIRPLQTSETLWWKVVSMSVQDGIVTWIISNQFVDTCER